MDDDEVSNVPTTRGEVGFGGKEPYLHYPHPCRCVVLRIPVPSMMNLNFDSRVIMVLGLADLLRRVKALLHRKPAWMQQPAVTALCAKRVDNLAETA
jgi:hypothetical protein